MSVDAASILDRAISLSDNLLNATAQAANALTQYGANTSTVIGFGTPAPLTYIRSFVTPGDVPVATGILTGTAGELPAYTDPNPITLDVGTPPAPTAGTPPTLIIGTAPTLDGLPDPMGFLGDMTVNFPAAPDAPNQALPEAPQLAGIVIPNVPTLNLPTLSAQRPQPLILFSRPADIKDYYGFTTETGRVYKSLTLQAVEERMLSDMQTGGTGITKDVQDAIWNEGIERDAIALTDAIMQMEDDYARKGFPSPPGELRKRKDDLVTKFTAARTDTSRKIMVTTADLAQKNTQFAIDGLLKAEDLHIRYAVAFADRMLAVAKACSDAAMAWINSVIAQFNAELDAYKTEVSVFETQLRAELQKVEIYKAELEAAKLSGDLNAQQVEIYKARLSALSVGTDIYRAQVGAYEARINAERSRIEVVQVKANVFQSLVQSKGMEIQAFEAQVKGETAKIDAYGKQVEADNTKMRGFATLVDAKAKEAEINVSNARTYTERFNALVSAYRAKSDALGTQSSNAANAFRAQIEAYIAGIDGQKAAVAADAEWAKVDVSHWQSESQLSIEQARLIVQFLLEESKLKVSQLSSVAQVYGSLASGAMSSVNGVAQVISQT